MLHTVVLSDVHLCEVEHEEGLWMRYRQRKFSPAMEIAAMLEALRERVAGDHLTLVLNGDVFDFDAPRVVARRSEFHNLPRTAEHAVPAIRAILDDHPEFVESVGRVLADGHELVVVSGNHDVQLTLPEVRDELASRLAKSAAREQGREGDAAAIDAARARIAFRAWFHKTPEGIVIEHGNQYDAYCSYRYPMAPFGHRAGEIQPTMGSLATRLLVSRMGYFNPHVDSSFMLSPIGYLVHWARFYMFSRRSLAFAWFFGAMRTLATLIRARRPAAVAQRRANILACAGETGVPVRTVARHARLFARPAEDELRRVVRELWVDRVALLGFSAVIAAVFLLFAAGHLTLGALLGPVVLIAYEMSVPKLALEATWKRVNRTARRVGAVHKARAVVLGHTHYAEGAWEEGVFYGNTGSWSAAFRDLECKQPLFDERPLVWLTSEGGPDGALSGGLWAWKHGRLEPRATLDTPPQSAGAHLESTTPGSEAANATAKNAVKPTLAAT